MHLDPFNKPFEKIVATDLERLRDVSEGWYIEYKSAPIAPRLVGKSLSAFANHFGGWLIFGVDAPNRKPSAFRGLSPTEVNEVMSSLREAARAHVNPSILYDTCELVGPVESLQLPEDRSVIVVLIRQGRNPPYIHSSGRIYRRIDDASDPKPETDRAVIDNLTRRATDYRERFRKRIETLPEFSKGESETPFLQIFLTNDPWQDRRISHFLTHNEFSEIMRRTDDASYCIALESSFPSGFGFTARHVGGNDPFNMLYTWQFSYSGFSSVTVPLRTLSEQNASRYKYVREFFKILPQSLHQRVIDTTALWIFLTSIIAKQDVLAKAIGIEGNIFLKLRFLNLWRHVPYVDTASFLRHVHSYGVPVVQSSEQLTPPGMNPDDMMEIAPIEEKLHQPQHESLIRAAAVLDLALGAIGVNHCCVTEPAELETLVDLLARAAQVQTGK